MTHVVPGTGGLRKPDTRSPPSDCAVWPLLGRLCSGAWPDYQSGREHVHAGNAERPGGRSAALAGAGLNSHSRTDDLQDGLEINRRACEERRLLQAFPVHRDSGLVPVGGES